MGAAELADHLKQCRGVDAVIAGDGNLDEVVETLLAAGWTPDGIEYVEGKRVRYLVPPPGFKIENDECCTDPTCRCEAGECHCNEDE